LVELSPAAQLRVMLHHEGTKDTKASVLALSYEVIGAAIEVHRILGPGLLESVYELALCKELWLRRIPVERQVNLPIHYKGRPLECSVKLDLLIQRSIIVEVKSVDTISSIHKAQLLTYLHSKIFGWDFSSILMSKCCGME
jgi:GxxExxY protein